MARTDTPLTYNEFVELVPVGDAGFPPWQAPVAEVQRGLSRRAWTRVLFVLCILIPNALAITYFGFVASDRFESEARFIVRNPQTASMGALSSLMAATGESRANDDAHVVNAFLESRDAAMLLASKHGLRDVLGRPEADVLMRYPRPFSEPTEESLYRHYLRFISTHYDTSSGIATLSVQSFRPDDSVRIATALLDAAERLANRLNERSRTDAMARAQGEVNLSRTRAREALDRLTSFRNRESVTDPVKLSAAVFEVIGRLTFERAQARAQLAEMERASPQNIQIPTLRGRINVLDEEISRERRQLAGGSDSLAPRLAEYERLVLDREFADRALASSMHSLEAARADVEKQQIYVERIVEPREADYARYPWRVSWSLLVLFLSVGSFIIMRALVLNLLHHGTF